ncbi:MAG TPA: hypothetical protein VMH04_06245 [Candidatus Solibacter sp.]|nr:hypothetical protein [Candidatus Solibacter sp.]
MLEKLEPDLQPHTTTRENADSSNNPKLGGISRSEIRFVALFTLVLCIVTTVPYVVGHVASFPGTTFDDVLVHSLDTNNYLAYARQAASGSWVFRNPMTNEPHRAVFVNLGWLVLGKIASTLHVSLGLAMGIQRLLCLVLMCAAVYWLSWFLFESVFIRRCALVATMTGGGFGWIVTLHLLHIPINSSYFFDLSNGNLFPFYWALKLPHFLVSESFIVLSFCFFLLAERCRRPWQYAAAGVCYMLAGLCRPYDMLFLMAATTIFLAFCCWENRGLVPGIALRSLPVTMCVPLLGYYYWIFKLHPIFHWWSLPGGGAPPALLLALSFGMSLVLLPIAGWYLLRRPLGNAERFLVCCLLTAIVLSHLHYWLHFSFQFATNIYVALIMLLMAGLQRLIIAWKDRSRAAGAVIVGLLVVNSLTSVALTGQAVVLVKHGDFRTDSELLTAFSWLDAHSQRDDVTLADFAISNEIPAYTHNIVYCGYLNAVNFDFKMKAMQEFFGRETSNGFREQMLRDNQVRFVVLTAAEARDLAPLSGAPFAQEVFRNNAAVIFKTLL